MSTKYREVKKSETQQISSDINKLFLRLDLRPEHAAETAHRFAAFQTILDAFREVSSIVSLLSYDLCGYNFYLLSRTLVEPCCLMNKGDTMLRKIIRSR